LQRIILGALAGFSATMAMTAAMRHLAPRLAPPDRYPLPPREITETISPARGERPLQTQTLLAHFGYGALTGAFFALLPRQRGAGVPYGVAVWALSYLGWIPALGILAPASRHPRERNLLMLAAHVVWGAALGAGLRELEDSAREVFSAGPLRDAHRSHHGGRSR
jgi:hypothetical protein